MKKIVILFLAALFINGCGTSENIIVPENVERTSHPMYISNDELQIVAGAAARSLMTDASFNDFLRKYKKEKNDPAAKPVLKVNALENDTEDPNLFADQMISVITGTLLKANKVELSAAEGVLRKRDVISARRIQDDESFEKPKRHLLKASRLALRIKVSSYTEKKPDSTVYKRFYSFSIIDVRDGVCIWTYNKTIGVKK